MTDFELTDKIIGHAINIHRTLGPGLLESAYRHCLYHDLAKDGITVEMERSVPIIYKDVKLDHGYRMDILVDNRIVVEIKTVEGFTDIHTAQVLTYLRLGKYKIGLLINFHTALLKNGIKRIVN